jgi:hypothetical protein
MSRSFNGSNQYAEATNVGLSSTNTATFACWFYPIQDNGITGIFISRTGGFSGLLFNSAAGNPFSASWNTNGYGTATGLNPTLNQWNFGAGVVTPANINAYLGTAGGTLNSAQTYTGNPGAISPTTWDLARDPGGNLLLDGFIAEAAIWNASLILPELDALLAGVPPHCVRPQALVGYWPLWGLQSPEPDLSGNANNMTLTGSPPQANHAPVTLFTRKARTAVEPAGTAGSVRIQRPVISLPPLSPALFE